MRYTFGLCILLSLFTSLESKAQLTVNSAVTNTALVSQHLLGPGVCAKNIRWTGTQNQRGTFNCTNQCNVGFSSGILITSGTVNNALGPNNATGTTSDLNLPGDPDLNTLSSANVHADAGVLEFDFSVAADSIEFRFVFASEEYNEYVGSGFNDCFGFFISGPGYPTPTNIALIPNTATQIAINNVNNGSANTGPCMNCAYFRDNTGGLGIEYDGMTVVLTAKAAVLPCTMYHFKMGVQDNGDGLLDSGVFLEANSFNATGEIPLYSDTDTLSTSDTLYLCPGDTIRLTLPLGPNGLWSTGDTTKTINVTQPGVYYGTLSDTCCFAFSAFITVLASPQTAVATAQGPTTFCNGDSVTISAVPNSPGLTYLWSNGATTPVIVVNSSGSYNVTISYTANCQAISQPVVVNVNSNPIALINPSGPTSFCQGSSVILTSANTANSYNWSTGETTSSITVSSTGVYTLSLTASGCTSTSQISVTVNSPAQVTINPPAVACIGQPTSLSATAGFTGYTWSNGTTGAITSVTTAGTYTVTATDINNCTSTSSYNFAPLPFTAPVIAAPNGFCSGQSATLTATAGYTNYLWSNNATTSQVTVTNGGTYSVTVTAANGCTGSVSATVAQWNLPIPAITGTFIVCDGTAATLNASPAGLNYAWSNGVTTQTINPLLAGTYTVTVTDANNCTASTTQAVTVNTAPIVSITGDFDACQGNPGLMDAGAGLGSYVWSTGDVSNSITPSVQGWYYVTVTNNGCSTLDSAFLTIYNLPQPQINGIAGFCPGLSTSLSANATFSSYAWSDGTTNASITVNTPGVYTLTVTDVNQCSNSTNLTVTQWPSPQPVMPATAAICTTSSYTMQPGTFNSYLWSDNSTTATLTVTTGGTYTVTVSDINGCTAIAATALTVNPLPVPAISGPSAICNGQTATFTAGTYASYQWSDGTSNPQLLATAPGTYTVTVTDANGCTASTSTSLIVHPLPLVAITGPSDFCDGGSVTIQTIPGQGTYAWNGGSTSHLLTVDQTGNYQVTVTSPDGCISSNSYQVNERPHPIVDFEIHQSPACNEILVQFENTTQAESGATYFWDFGDNTSSIKISPQHSYYDPGTYLVQLFATSPYGCKADDTLTFQVDFPPAPIASFTFTPDIVSIYNSHIRLVNTSQHAVKYKWNFGDGQWSEDENPEHTFDKIGEQIITLFAYNSEQCYDEYELPLEVVPFWIPSAFTPNNDGKNDYFFEAGYTLDVRSFSMQIFDRWGKQVFRSDAISKPWDGNVSGTPASEGVYTYLIKVTSVNGKETPFKGTFSLVR